MADRERYQDTNRTPTAVPADALAANTALLDLSDFAPSLKGGLAGGNQDLVVGTGENLVHDGGFEEGVGTWVAGNAATTLSVTTAHSTEGSQSLKLTTDGTDQTVMAQSPTIAIPDGTAALSVSCDTFFNRVSSTGNKFGAIYLYDATGALLTDSAVLTRFTPSGFSEFRTVAFTVPVPANAAQFILQFGNQSSSGNMVVGESALVDNVQVVALPVFGGLTKGTGWFPGGINCLSVVKVALPDTPFTSGLGVFQAWNAGGGTGRITFNKDATWQDLTISVEGVLYGRVTNAAAAQRTARVRVDISTDNGATWNAGDVLSFNIDPVGGSNQATVSYPNIITVLASDVVDAILVRAVFTQTNGIGNDCSGVDGVLTGKLYPVSQ